MTDHPDAQLLRTALDALNAGDLDACVELMHPNFLINLAGLPTQLVGRDVWRAGVELLRAAFPDVQMEIEDTFAVDGRVAVRNTIRGTHRGDFHGVAPTGRTIEVMSNEIYRVGNGLILEEWIVTDNATLFAQITEGLPLTSLE
ncbi:ester cyclase [Prauserella cavernicola]|uniref:Ester cyclase n=1 Tax=Prauserella cavernicola TaxID=2800127 RepID=A0A934QSI0_9PSEU|nr:ester cyclase [Prauserella cavernicola]MBK1787432.1 ester cyclase [Prauserella cavernicola]